MTSMLVHNFYLSILFSPTTQSFHYRKWSKNICLYIKDLFLVINRKKSRHCWAFINWFSGVSPWYTPGWKKIKLADSKKQHFSKLPILNILLWKFHGLVLGLVELIDAKDIDVVQPVWSWGCPTSSKTGKKCIFCVFRLF